MGREKGPYGKPKRLRARKRIANMKSLNTSFNYPGNNRPHYVDRLQDIISPRGRIIIGISLGLYLLISLATLGWKIEDEKVDVVGPDSIRGRSNSKMNKIEAYTTTINAQSTAGRQQEDNTSASFTEFSIQSNHMYPMLFVTLFGYESYPIGGNNTNNNNAVAKFVYLGNGTETAAGMSSSPIPILIRVDTIQNNVKGRHHWLWNQNYNSKWTIVYKLNTNFHVPEWASNLVFEMSIRIEYSSFHDAILDYPTQNCSFQGFLTPIQNVRIPSFEMQEQLQHEHQKVSAFPSQPWLWRQNPNMDWTVYPADGLLRTKHGQKNHKSHHCKPWNEKRSYRLVIIGDSQPSYMCHHLLALTTDKELSTSSPRYSCVTIKGNFTDDSRTRLKDFSSKYSEEIVNATSTVVSGGSGVGQPENFVVVFNTQGLWETAYGQLDAFRTMLDNVLNTSVVPSLLPHQQKSNSSLLFVYLTTTAVHPNNYNPGIYQDSRKWAMTQPRVHAINLVSRERIERIQKQHRENLLLVDVEGISLLREDDPMVKGDMRHYGNTTNELLLNRLLCSIDNHINK